MPSSNDPQPQPESYTERLKASIRELRSKEKEWDEIITTIEAEQAKLDRDSDAEAWDKLEIERRISLRRRDDVRREQLAKCEWAAKRTGLTAEEVRQVILREDLKADQKKLAYGPASPEAETINPQERMPCEHKCFSHSDDYRMIRFADQNYTLPPNAADVVRKLHEAYKRNLPDVSKATLVDSDMGRLQDQFRKVDRQLLRTLIVRTPHRRDMYRLNIPCPICTGLSPGPKDNL